MNAPVEVITFVDLLIKNQAETIQSLLEKNKVLRTQISILCCDEHTRRALLNYSELTEHAKHIIDLTMEYMKKANKKERVKDEATKV